MKRTETISKQGFFEKLADYMEDGDRLYVKYDTDENGDTDWDNKIYSVYNSCNIIWEYFEKTNMLCMY